MKKIIKGKAYYCRTATPNPSNAKFHASMYQIGIATDFEEEMVNYYSRNQDHSLKYTDDGKVILNFYSKFPFNLFIRTEKGNLPIEKVNSDYDNLTGIANGTDMAVSCYTYENNFGVQLGCDGVLLNELPKQYNPFEDF